MKILDKINDKTFDDVICYVFAEPGAMGAHCTIECMTSRGEVFTVHYDFEETSWEKIKECWPAINGCKFNGAHANCAMRSHSICIGGSAEPVTTLNPGYKELAFDCGNHFICKDEYYDEFLKLFSESEAYEVILYGFDKIIEKGIKR